MSTVSLSLSLCRGSDGLSFGVCRVCRSTHQLDSFPLMGTIFPWLQTAIDWFWARSAESQNHTTLLLRSTHATAALGHTPLLNFYFSFFAFEKNIVPLNLLQWQLLSSKLFAFICLYLYLFLFFLPLHINRPAPVKWAQRGDLVYLNFEVQDVANPEVAVTKDTVTYKWVFVLLSAACLL